MIFGNIIRQTLTKTLSIVNEPTGFVFFFLLSAVLNVFSF